MSTENQNTGAKPVQSIQPVSRFARAKGTCDHFQISRSTLWQWVKSRPGFPKPLKVGQKVTLFDLNAIEYFLRAEAEKWGSHDQRN